MTAATGGHRGWHPVRPCACHLSLGLWQEPSKWSRHHFLPILLLATRSDCSLRLAAALCQALVGCQGEQGDQSPSCL